MSYAEDHQMVLGQVKTLRFHERSCGNKIKFKTEARANARVDRMKERGIAHQPDKLHCYRCRFCGFWHVGNGVRNIPAIKGGLHGILAE